MADSDRTGLTVIPLNIIGNILKMIIWRGIYESGTARIDTSAWQSVGDNDFQPGGSQSLR